MPDSSPPVELLDDPGYRSAVVDLLGLLAYGELAGFHRLSHDSSYAPTLSDSAELAGIAHAEYEHFVLLRDRLIALGADPEQAMAPFHASYATFHETTAAHDWLESLVNAYVGEGIARDFYRVVADTLDPVSRQLVLAVLEDARTADFVVDRVTTAIQAHPPTGARLALWGRRLVGEAMAQANGVALQREGLAALVAGVYDSSTDVTTRLGTLVTTLTSNHSRRMARLGLAA